MEIWVQKIMFLVKPGEQKEHEHCHQRYLPSPKGVHLHGFSRIMLVSTNVVKGDSPGHDLVKNTVFFKYRFCPFLGSVSTYEPSLLDFCSTYFLLFH